MIGSPNWQRSLGVVSDAMCKRRSANRKMKVVSIQLSSQQFQIDANFKKISRTKIFLEAEEKTTVFLKREIGRKMKLAKMKR